MANRWTVIAIGVVAQVVGCSSGGGSAMDGGSMKTDAEFRAATVAGMHDALLQDIQALGDAAKAIQAAAPQSSAWDPVADAKALHDMRSAWVDARTAYEHVEGALAPLFPNIDFSIDARYDDFMTELAAQGGDPYLFDDSGVTGMHALERILYSDTTPARVVTFEKALPGYKAAAFPKTSQEAADFRLKLCGKLLSDQMDLQDQWQPANIDIAISFQGLISLMNEQREKVVKASSNEEESRYSQRTMADLRDNLLGSKAAYALFQPWILSKQSTDPRKDGKTIDAKILKGFAALDAAYGAVTGPAIPEPPATWSAEMPSAKDLETPFGRLYSSVHAAVDPASSDSVVAQMNDAAALLGFPEFASP